MLLLIKCKHKCVVFRLDYDVAWPSHLFDRVADLSCFHGHRLSWDRPRTQWHVHRYSIGIYHPWSLLSKVCEEQVQLKCIFSSHRKVLFQYVN